VKTLLWILGAIALVVVLAGAVNHSTEVSIDYLVGSTASFSVFWLALVVALVLLAAAVAGWSVGRAGMSDARGKLEKELEATYRRLRECEARLPQVTPAAAETLAPVALAAGEPSSLIAPRGDEASTAVLPAPDESATTAPASDEREGTTSASDPVGDDAPPSGETAAS
jgi:hypothetical protein